ncbi:MAG: ABC transporter ATP-binding protein [Deltaproteobacteria bacterium]|nr:ABC transporter ATP-binding protein [Deltaproteobacteria bacterium]
MNAPLIHLEKVCKTYRMGEEVVHALQDVTLDINGGLVAIMGASGSGKSTMMNVIGCLDRPSSGSYFLEGQDVSKMGHNALADIRNRTIGFVFQSFHLLSRTSAIENVELPLVYAGVSGKERKRRAEEALKRVGLGARIHHHPNQLSGGQQQRVAIARAIVSKSKLLMADEPTGNLDSRTSIEIMALFQELWREGMTIVLVTHEPDIAAFASRVVVMKDGEVLTDREQEPVVAVVPPPASRPGVMT